MNAQLCVRRLGPADLRRYRPRFLDLYREVYSEPPYSETEEHVAAYAERFVEESARSGFAVVVAESGTELAGYAYGHSFAADDWWQDADQEPAETKGCTKFAVMELAVRRPCRGRGVGTRLMGALIDGRPEQLATLCSNPAAPARQIYHRWGWQPVAVAHPPNIPPMEILVLWLPEAPTNVESDPRAADAAHAGS
ncbi:GNAT family N-acetyltransferase [Micromonospora zhanjiangensis]|uniref:GNAT family N-acetyltransferase n=1 Tax=Micromonospora zhanjiangensis TaxID=1522057 RepID=A0ABV8KW62_9ACTN